MGYTREEIKEALTSQKYNEVTATYLLLGRKTEVRRCQGHLGFGMPGLEELLWQREPGAEARCLSPCRRVGTGALQHWPWQGCGRPATPPMEQAPAKAPATAKGNGVPPPPTTASAGTATSVSMAHPQSGSLVASNRNPLESIAWKRGLSYRDAGTSHGPWRQECTARLREGSETGKAARPRADTVCVSLPLCSFGFSFLYYLTHLILFPVSLKLYLERRVRSSAS